MWAKKDRQDVQGQRGVGRSRRAHRGPLRILEVELGPLARVVAGTVKGGAAL